MSDKKAGERKPSSNKSIRKLRAANMVCSLTSSWQQWVTENEKKQASEPSGWAPSSIGGQPEEHKNKWTPKKSLPTQTLLTPESHAGSQISPPQGAPISEGVQTSEEALLPSRIRMKQVVKTVSSSIQEKCTGVTFLAEKMKRESLPSGEEIDRFLKKKSSPTRHRKCSNMVSSLTKSWKQVENEQKLGKEGGGPGDGHSCGQDKGGREKEKNRINEQDAQTGSEAGEQGDSEKDSVRIKRPQVSIYKKEAEDANKINALSKKHSTVGNLKSRWQNWAVEHTVNQKLNPFSEYFDYDYSMSLRLQKGKDGYGHPKEGTKTAERAKRAEQHIHREIDDMCYVIRTMADPDPDGKTRITFGELFDRYVRISDKVVGILMRARKHGKVAFEGEMLWQGQDDGVIITLMV
ncbi:actin binding Rho activating protein b [Girardinichthys multiradiatus]|uniref:actin binding Rho activating protein b n=1 Tax=Girardinichthys multiradiatus TaxID=208333 RepID=UPI001FABAE5B|nr:actin binding Rho activating protein b [Girardinichthys multiradiatus]